MVPLTLSKHSGAHHVFGINDGSINLPSAVGWSVFTTKPYHTSHCLICRWNSTCRRWFFFKGNRMISSSYSRITLFIHKPVEENSILHYPQTASLKCIFDCTQCHLNLVTFFSFRFLPPTARCSYKDNKHHWRCSTLYMTLCTLQQGSRWWTEEGYLPPTGGLGL